MANTKQTNQPNQSEAKQHEKAEGNKESQQLAGPEQGVPTNENPVPIQVVSRDELAKPEYELKNGRLEIERGHPNFIFDNQRNQQAAENTVEVAAGIRNEDGTLKPNHPQAEDANPSVVKDQDK